MNVAITGASGLVGMALCRQLIDEGHQVKSLVHKSRHGLDELPVHLISGGLNDFAALQELSEGADAFFHVAAQISIGDIPEQQLWETNVTGTAQALKACQEANVKRFIYFSSVHAYRSVPVDQVFDESAQPAFAFPYERTKAAAQDLVLKANGQHGMETFSLNPTAVLGPWDYTPSLQGQMLIDLLKVQIPFLSPGGFDWVDSRDIALAAVNMLQKGRPGEAYLLSGRYATMVELARLIGLVSGRRAPGRTLPFWFLEGISPLMMLWSRATGQRPLFTKESLSHVKSGHPNVSHAKAAQDLDYSPRPLEQTLEDMYHWFSEHYLKKQNQTTR